jgi:hypothetical protein
MVLGAALGCAGFILWAGHLTHMSLGAQWPYIVMAGAGIGLLLGPATPGRHHHRDRSETVAPVSVPRTAADH